MKTVGFLTVLQPSEEPKLTMPCTSQKPLSAWQFSGPPESPCARPGDRQPWGFPHRQAWEAGAGGGGWSQWGIWAGAPYFGLSLSMVREAEEMRFGGARLACRLLCDLGLMITLSVPQFP